MSNLSHPIRDSDHLDAVNPATGEIFATFPTTPVDTIPQQVHSSRQAFESWSCLAIRERAIYLHALRNHILGNIDQIADTINRDNGKTLVEAVSMEIYPACDLISYFAKHTEQLLRPERLSIGIWAMMLRTSKIHYTPKGVVGIISPWNYPFLIPLGEVVIALIAGNTVILKPSEHTPAVGHLIGELMKEIGLPSHVFTLAQGSGDVGAAIINAQVDHIVFTGSVETGKKIMAAAAPYLTPVTLELGGKDPMIVCHDANIDVASSAAVWGAFSNAGQTCASVERVYVDARVKDQFIALVREKANQMVQSGQMGVITTDFQSRKIQAHIDDAQKNGATVWRGGPNPGNVDTTIMPTIITDIDHTFACVREETFGPTLPIMTFTTEAEAIARANDSAYGLTASVWTTDIRRGKAMAKQINAGTVIVNDCIYTYGIPQTPWGGVKSSGFGRTHGPHGLLEMMHAKHIHINRLHFLKNFWWYTLGRSLYDRLKSLTHTLTAQSVWGMIRSLPTIVRLIMMKKI